MAEYDNLVAAILAAPGDDALRLVFADWLEEHADPRAGCVRLAARLRTHYGPRRPDYSRSFWETLGRGIEPAWWAKEARRLAEEVNDKVGDGCKTAVLIALALSEAKLLFPEDAALPDAGRTLEAIGRRAEDGVRTGAELGRCLHTAALGDEEIAKAMLRAFELAGMDGCIRVEPAGESRSQERVRLRGIEGLRFPFGPTEAEGRELRPAAVFVWVRPLHAEDVHRVLALYGQVASGLLCLCPGIDVEGAELFRNAVQNGAQIILCGTPVKRFKHWRDCCEDAAAATGASIIYPDEEVPVEVTRSSFGQAGSIRVEAGQVVILQPAGARDHKRNWIAHLRQLIDDEPSEEQKEWHSLRLAQFTGGVMEVAVHGESPSETEQLEGLTCKTLHAGRGTIEEGYVPGGGTAYLRAAADFEDPASAAMHWALEEPTRTLLASDGRGVKDVLASLRADDRLGFDLTRDKLPRWRKAGPLDPTKVVRTVIECALESARRNQRHFRRGAVSG